MYRLKTSAALLERQRVDAEGVCPPWRLTSTFHLTAGHVGDRAPGSSILSEGQSSQSGIFYSSVPSQPVLQPQALVPPTQSDQTQQQLSVVSVAPIDPVCSCLFRSFTLLMFVSAAGRVNHRSRASSLKLRLSHPTVSPLQLFLHRFVVVVV